MQRYEKNARFGEGIVIRVLNGLMLFKDKGIFLKYNSIDNEEPECYFSACSLTHAHRKHKNMIQKQELFLSKVLLYTFPLSILKCNFNQTVQLNDFEQLSDSKILYNSYSRKFLQYKYII